MKSVEFYLKGLFRNIDRTAEINDQIEELSCHIRDRVRDLCSNGMSEDEALEKTIQGLGNLDELIDTISGKRIRIRKNRISMLMMVAGTVYGGIYLFFVTIALTKWYLGTTALYITIPAFTGYLVPLIFSISQFLRCPEKMTLVPVPLRASLRASFSGWILISSVCVTANVLMLGPVPQTNLWSWMPVAGLFTWPLMDAVQYYLSKKEPVLP